MTAAIFRKRFLWETDLFAVVTAFGAFLGFECRLFTGVLTAAAFWMVSIVGIGFAFFGFDAFSFFGMGFLIAGDVTEQPHFGQNFAAKDKDPPQLAQTRTNSKGGLAGGSNFGRTIFAPHFGQNFAVSETSMPQLGQFIMVDLAFR